MIDTNNLNNDAGRTLSSTGTMSSFLDFAVENDLTPEDSKILEKPKPSDDEVDVNRLLDGEVIVENTNIKVESEGVKGDVGGNDDVDAVEKPSSVSPEEEKKTTGEAPRGIDYREVFNNLVSMGVYEDLESIEVEGGEIIPFKDFKLDAESFASLIKTKFEEIEKSAVQNKVSLEGVSDFTQKLINIEKSGGNVNQALQVYKDYVNPLENFDLTTEVGQMDMLRLRYMAEGKLQSDEIDAIIHSFKNSGVLEEKSLLAKEQMENAVNRQLQSIELEGQKRLQEEQERIKAYRSSLGESLTSQFSLNESTKRRYLDVATKYVVDEADGVQKLPIDILYENALLDPNKASRLLMFLINEDEYNKQVSEEAVRKTNIKTMRLTGVISKDKSSNTKLRNSHFDERDSGEIDVDKL